MSIGGATPERQTLLGFGRTPPNPVFCTAPQTPEPGRPQLQ